MQCFRFTIYIFFCSCVCRLHRPNECAFGAERERQNGEKTMTNEHCSTPRAVRWKCTYLAIKLNGNEAMWMVPRKRQLKIPLQLRCPLANHHLKFYERTIRYDFYIIIFHFGRVFFCLFVAFVHLVIDIWMSSWHVSGFSTEHWFLFHSNLNNLIIRLRPCEYVCVYVRLDKCDRMFSWCWVCV